MTSFTIACAFDTPAGSRKYKQYLSKTPQSNRLVDVVKTQQPLLKHFSSINLYFTHKSNFPIKEQNCCAYTNQVLSNLRKIHLNNFFFQFLALCSPFLFLMMGDYCNCVFYFVILLPIAPAAIISVN